MESSTSTTRRPSRTSPIGLSFIRMPWSRIDCAGSMKVLPTYRFLTRPSAYGMRLLEAAKPCAAGMPLSGTGTTMSPWTGACSASRYPIRQRAAWTLLPCSDESGLAK